MRIIVDAQLPPALARALKQNGFDCSHVFELEFLNAPDEVIWNWALKEKAAILTKDEDFAQLRRSSHAGPPVIWVRIGNSANVPLLRRLLPRMPELVRAIDAGEVLIEIR
jgi:predicted nuclease of predicted toxin-antitoxin system